jgi:hypothetical protein
MPLAALIPEPVPAGPAPERWVTKSELAAHFGYSRRWVELRQREGLPSQLIGGQRRYRLSHVERFLGLEPDDRFGER